MKTTTETAAVCIMNTDDSDLLKIEEFVQLNGKALLEIGCGDGRLTALLVHRAKTVTAIDPDERNIAAARRNISGAKFLAGSGERLGFANESFDIVLFSYSLHHQDCVKALAEAKRVVRQDRQILVIEPKADGEYTMLVSIFEEDEILRLQQTLEYVSSSAFNILRKDTYCVKYTYPDERAMYDYFTNKYMTDKDDRAVDKMRKIIGNKTNDSPVVIQDMVNIFLIGG